MVGGVELRHLRYFVGVAELSSFTKAARKLHVAQPALSRQIRQLEDEVGARLLERDRQGARLTEAGRAFLAEATALLKQSDDVMRSAQKRGGLERRQLNIGYVWGLFHSLAPAALSRFRAQFPDVAVNLLDLTAVEQARLLADGELDAGFIGLAHEADAAGLAKRKVGACAFVAALPANHPAARRSRVPLAALAPEFFIAISEQNYPGAARFVVAACEQAGFRPKILQVAERGHAILGLVAGACGVALLPEPLRALPHPGVIFRPVTPSAPADLFIAWRQDRAQPLTEAFIKLCA